MIKSPGLLDLIQSVCGIPLEKNGEHDSKGKARLRQIVVVGQAANHLPDLQMNEPFRALLKHQGKFVGDLLAQLTNVRLTLQ